MKKWIQLNENNVNQLKVGDKLKLVRFSSDSSKVDWYKTDLGFEIGDVFTVDEINLEEEIWLIPPDNRDTGYETICCNFDRLERFAYLAEIEDEEKENIDSYSFEEIYKWLEPKIMKNIPEGKVISINSALRDIIAICYKAGYVRGKKDKSFKIDNKQNVASKAENEHGSNEWSVTYINGCD